jgi:nickel transport protein
MAALLAIVLGSVAPAEAHRLKLFVTAEAGEITGYAFFVGGGRPEGVDFVVKDAAGGEVFRGKTDDRGNFRWRPATAADYAITVDAGDGHRVEGKIAGDLLGAATAPSEAAAAQVPASAPVAATAAPAPLACPAPAAVDPAAISRIVAAEVDRSVARQLRPLLEAYDQAEGRLRLNDVMGGVGMIVGLAGAGLWATSRRRRREP